MRHVFLHKMFCGALAVCLLAASPVFAQAGDEGSTIEQGRSIKLFDGESPYGWAVDGGQSSVSDGAMRVEGANARALFDACRFKAFELEVEGRGGALLLARDGDFSDGGKVVRIPLEAGETDWATVRVMAKPSGVYHGDDESEPIAEGAALWGVGFGPHAEVDGPLELRSAKLTPINLGLLFNGEDLSGWQVVPGHDCEFGVEDGVLKVAHGRGQIETDELFKDFLLQLEVKVNGDGLNSGVFVRSVPGTFWKGYESQLRNAWKDDDRTQPVDFGTGGLYAIQPARRVVSDDFEWFGKTIVADGNRFAVWVKGILVTAYHDTRPVNDQGDAKAGLVDKAGRITIQGHDPTTDLEFRAIHIQEYPPE